MSIWSNEFAGCDMVGITGTYYPNLSDIRFEVSLETAERWRDNGRPFIVVDGSPADDSGKLMAQRAYQERGAVVLPADSLGIATQRQQGAEYAVLRGASNVLTLEPEKPDVVDVAYNIAQLLDLHSVVVIGRTPESLASLPPTQRRTEVLAGWILEKTLEIPADSLAGPRGYSKDGMRHLLNYPAQQAGMNNWLYLFETVMAAQRAGQKVVGMPANLHYRPKMTDQETGNEIFDAKRYLQFRLQLEYLLASGDLQKQNGGREIARVVLDRFAAIPEHPSNYQYEKCITAIEAQLIRFGYRKPH